MSKENYNTHNFIAENRSGSYLILIGCILAGFFIAQFASMLAAGIFHNFNFNEVISILSPPFNNADDRTTLLVAQGANSFVLFILTPLFYLHFYEGANINTVFNTDYKPSWQLLAITVIMVIIYMPISAFTAHYNEAIEIPGAFGNFARQMEDQLKDLTLFMVDFNSLSQFILGLIVIAVIPGIGEELLFRGVIQNKLSHSFGNIHTAIWVTAFIFSAFHLQFYGFLPRMLLGGLFGYLYIWSGSLWVPMLAHFVNNGFTLLMMYLYNTGTSELDLDSSDSYNIPATLMSVIIVSGLLWYFKKTKLSHS
jgi:hypothetical protein